MKAEIKERILKKKQSFDGGNPVSETSNLKFPEDSDFNFNPFWKALAGENHSSYELEIIPT